MAANAKKDLYAVLGLAPTATPAMIRAAFRSLVRERDRGAQLRELVAAYEVLSSAEQREQYDRARQPRAPHAGSVREAVSTPPLVRPERVRASRDAKALPQPEPVQSSPRERRATAGQPALRAMQETPIASRPPAPAVTLLGTESDVRRTTFELEARLSPEDARSGTVISLNLPRGERCVRCDGSKVESARTCASCRGTGLSLDPKPVEVRLPSGLTDGSRLVIDLDRQGLPGTSIGVRVRIRGARRVR